MVTFIHAVSPAVAHLLAIVQVHGHHVRQLLELRHHCR